MPFSDCLRSIEQFNRSCHFYFLFMWWIIVVRPKSPADGGRLKWGSVGLNTQSPPRKWKSMLDVTDGGKLTPARTSSPTKSSSPKTPMTVGRAPRSGTNRRTSSPSPLRHGIAILSSWCFVMLPDALCVLVAGWRALLKTSCAQAKPFFVFCLTSVELWLWWLCLVCDTMHLNCISVTVIKKWQSEE